MTSSRKMPSHGRYILFLLALFLAWWLLLAIHPVDRSDWALENALVAVAIGVLALTWRWFRFSRTSYTLIFLFLCLHEVGAHYTYAKVPYDAWCQALSGRTLGSIFGTTRNHFDRLGHFSFGLLLSYPMREIFTRVADARGFWSYYLPLDMTMAFSMLFELFEWWAAVFFGGDLGVAYLGMQGDVWDAQKDMAMATLGGLLAMIVTALVNLHHQRDFAREWSDSLKIKKTERLAPSGR
jgi:putative membrane protein